MLLEIPPACLLAGTRARGGPDGLAPSPQYLAGRLFEIKAEREKLRGDLQDRTARLESAVTDATRLGTELTEEREAHGRTKHEMASVQARLLAEAKERALEELKEVQQRGERERAALEAKHRESEEALQERAASLDAQVHALQDMKYALDTKVSDLSARLGTAEGELAAVREDNKSLRVSNAELDREKHEQMKEISAHLIKLSSLEQQVADKDALLREQKQRLDTTEAHTTTLDSSWKEVRESLARAEERAAAGAAEVRKGNQIIEKLQSELRDRDFTTSEFGGPINQPIHIGAAPEYVLVELVNNLRVALPLEIRGVFSGRAKKLFREIKQLCLRGDSVSR